MPQFQDILGYEVLSTLGRGAKSTIFAVRDPKDGSRYALKRVEKTSPSDQRFIDQAVSEHDVASKFDHPLLRRSFKLFKQRNFIRTSEVLVLMELVEGVTLEQYEPAGMVERIDICRDVAEGLGVMHARKMVHADMKPNNVLVSPDRSVKIIDFGQSCPIGTQKERIQGTPDYIAPEQVLKRAITPQTDVFNLGATMYWLLTRKHVPTLIPKGKPGVTLRSENDKKCVPPMELNPAVPPALSSVVMDCIEADPNDRPRSMTEVVSRLEIAGAQAHRRAASNDGGSENGTGFADPDAEPDAADVLPRRNAS